MDIPPQEDPIASDTAKDSGAEEMNPFLEFINNIAYDDSLTASGELPDMDLTSNMVDESDFDRPHTELLSAQFLKDIDPTINSGTFPDFENQDTTMAINDADPCDIAAVQKRRRNKAQRPPNKPLPMNAEIIDLESLQVKGTYIKKEGEDEDVQFIKAEPGVTSFAFIRWPNSEDQPLCLSDDDDEPPPPPPLVTGSNNSKSLEQGRATMSNSPNNGLGNSILTGKSNPAPGARLTNSTFRNHLRKAQVKAGIRTQRGQKKVSNGGESLVPGSSIGQTPTLLALPVRPIISEASSAAGPSAPLYPAITPANTSAPRASASEFVASLAGPSSGPSQHLNNGPSLENTTAEDAEMDANIQGQVTNDTYSDEYLDAAQELKEKRLAYKARGKKDGVEEIQLMKAQGNLDSWKKKLEEDKLYAAEETLFVPDNTLESHVAALANYKNGSEQEIESELKAKPRGRPGRKGRGEKSKAGKPPKSKDNNDKVKDPNAKISKKPTKSKKAKGGPVNTNPNLLDLGSLFTSDVFRAAQANQGQRQLPAMDSTRRDQALKQLVSSVPLEHRKMAQVDKSYLNSACRDFVGKMSVKAVPGNDGWHVTGLTCVLKHHQLLGNVRLHV